MDKLVGFVLEQVVYRILIFLHKRHYVIPADTSKNNIIKRNVLVDLISISADWVCTILILYGWGQRIITYISLMTIALYAFVEQYKIYQGQYQYLNSDEYVCEIRQKQYKYLKKYTPNLRNMVIAGLAFVILMFMAFFEKIGYYEPKTLILYRCCILIILGILVFIKTKYIFLDMFDVDEFTYKKVDG